MPASFLTRAVSHLLHLTKSVFGETEVVQGRVYVWFAGEADGTVYDIPVPSAISQARRQNKDIIPGIDMEQDEITVHCDSVDLPFPIAVDTIFLIGEAAADAERWTAVGDTKWIITKLNAPPVTGTTAVRFNATKHV